MKTIALWAAALAGTAAAQTVSYNNVTDFLNNVQSGFYDEGFGGLAAGPADTLDFAGNGFGYTASSTIGVDPGSDGLGGLFNDPGLLSLNIATDALRIDFTQGNVTAVGGDFFASDIFFFQVPATVIVGLSDGTTTTFNGSRFAGFTSSNAIDFIVIDADDASLGGPAWPTVDRLIVGTAIPAPAGLAVLGMGLLAARRRR